MHAMLDLIKDQMLLVDPRRRSRIDRIIHSLNEMKEQLANTEMELSGPSQMLPGVLNQANSETLQDFKPKVSTSPVS